ncbi:glycerophosphocholine phosphodiesterase GPCPD1 isoform X1 [Aedes aegypti]|uniref:Glycerophosphocholine phosphodiesterase GPCPD1 n=1 Tax=Aedes aegypti TaxID=7159 RepID=A0A6I8TRZ3_AEDAE|nr:glycerophosphocholine phosphodiesterase GPCPD1 isoform X1 [Aedes aegypti]XP_021700232.1 glycerophosphocholine phosphodiesterase GPCPD1 isoform X1 [Aedes aegypti]XP_021700233.1 glycerophosphocholine phosphodiesterase GPCPD1 isoform X1 [Aedes aegypti]
MQRWWFLDEKNGSASSLTSSPGTSTKKTKPSKPVGDRRHKFRVLVTYELLKDETIAVTGNCEALGNWEPEHCVQMQLEDGSSNIWYLEIDLPQNVAITYRYFICSMDPTSENVHVRRFETHIEPRTIPIDGASSQTDQETKIDTLGDIDGSIKLDRGWLTSETIIQFKFFDNPFLVKERIKNRLLYVKITPMNLRINAESQSLSTLLDESLSSDTRENGTDHQAYAFTEVVSMGNPKATFEQQSQFGCPYHPEDFLVFNVTVAEPENVAYLVDLYTYSSRSKEDEPPYHLGYHYILPNFLKKSEGILELPVTCASKHRPLGMMRIEYLKVTPLLPSRCNLERSFIRYWNKRWTGLDVGHRGSGTSFKASDGNVIRENTIASLKNAVAHGADMVEFDVQLSKDLVPVIYHDFDIYVSLKRKTTLEINDMLELPMRELTLEQLKNLKVYHVVEGRNREARFFDEDLDEHQPFPQLADALELIDPHCGFNIEIKWSQKLKDGSMESDLNFDSNLYVDCILKVVLEKAGNRRIVFSCFDADICTMLRLKQNLYPVMFLTLGVTSKYPSYHDPRCNSIEMAVRNSCATELLGIVAHTEDLLRDQTQVNLATEKGLIVFCWGDDNNCKDTIKHLKSLGIHAIIYDKMDIYSDKTVKESVFLVGARESQAALLQQIDIENRHEQIVHHDFVVQPKPNKAPSIDATSNAPLSPKSAA